MRVSFCFRRLIQRPLMAGGTAAENTILAGFHAGSAIHSDCAQPQPEQFPDRGCPGRHAMLETKIVDDSQFIRGKHHLQSLVTDLVHGTDTFEAD